MAEKQAMEGQAPVPPPYSEPSPSAPYQPPPPTMQQPAYAYNMQPEFQSVHQPMQPTPPVYGQPAPPGYQGVPVQPLPGQYGVPMVGGQTIVVTTAVHNSRVPANCVCMKCQQNIITQTEYETGGATWILFGIICLLGGWVFCLCLIPFCINDLKDVHHKCPNCKAHIATCRRM